MDRDGLRALQAPLKARYRAEPDAALVTLAASATLDEGMPCSVQTGRAIAQAGLHPATGGDGTLLCSGDMLLEALVACAGVTLRAVAISLAIPVSSGSVRAEGDLDFRGSLAVDRETPVGFSSIRLLSSSTRRPTPTNWRGCSSSPSAIASSTNRWPVAPRSRRRCPLDNRPQRDGCAHLGAR